MPATTNDTEPLLSAYHFNYTQRPRRDKAWALAYILLLLLTLGWALVSLIFRPDLIAVLSSADYLDDPNHCPITLTTLPTTDPTLLAWRGSATSVAATAHSGTSLADEDGGSLGAGALPASSPSGFSAWATWGMAAAREAAFPAAQRAVYYMREDQLDWEMEHQLQRGHFEGSEQQDQGRQGQHEQEEQEQLEEDQQQQEQQQQQRRQRRRLSEQPHRLAEDWAPLGRRQDGGEGQKDEGGLPRVLLDYGGLLLLISLGAAVVLALLFVLALRFRPWALVLLACGLQVGAPLASAFVASRAGNSTLALLLLLIAAALAVSLYCGRDALGLVSRLLGLAAVALRDNAALLGLVAVLKIALAGATALLVAAATVVVAAGEVVPNPLRAGNPRCATPGGHPVTCCALAPGAGLPAYLPAAAITLAWTLLLLFELKVYVVSGVVAQWYFSPAGHLSGGGYYGGRAAAGAATGDETAALLGHQHHHHHHDGGAGRLVGGGGGGSGVLYMGGYSSSRALLASLGHALGPSFGSLCAASGVLGATTYLRAVVHCLTVRSRRQALLQYAGAAGSSPFLVPAATVAAGAAATGACCCPLCCACCGLLACLPPVCSGCCGCCVALLEQLTKFATVQMSMSGLGFWRASQEVVALLRRNFMDAYNMWWYLPMVLHCGGAAFAAAWGYAAYWLARQCWAPFTHAAPLNATAAATLGALAAATAELVLAFVCSVLVNIADALFICFVLDRDSGAVTWYDLHCVYAALPCCAVARAAAEGQYAAAAAAAAAPPAYYYVPPSMPSYGGAGASYVPYGYQVAPGGAGHAQLGQPVGFGQQRPQYGGGWHGSGGGGGGFWGWFRSPSGSGTGPYGMPVGGSRYRSERPQHPPPAVLSPPYSDQRFPVRGPVLAPPAPPPFFGSPIAPS